MCTHSSLYQALRGHSMLPTVPFYLEFSSPGFVNATFSCIYNKKRSPCFSPLLGEFWLNSPTPASCGPGPPLLLCPQVDGLPAPQSWSPPNFRPLSLLFSTGPHESPSSLRDPGPSLSGDPQVHWRHLWFPGSALPASPAARQTEARGPSSTSSPPTPWPFPLPSPPPPQAVCWFFISWVHGSVASLTPHTHPVTRSILPSSKTPPWFTFSSAPKPWPLTPHLRAPPPSLHSSPWLWPVVICLFYRSPHTVLKHHFAGAGRLGDLLNVFTATDKRTDNHTQLASLQSLGAPQPWHSNSRHSLYHQLSVIMGLFLKVSCSFSPKSSGSLGKLLSNSTRILLFGPF